MIPELTALRVSPTRQENATVWHSHPLAQMGGLIDGREDVHLPQGVFQLKGGDFFFLHPGHMHQIHTYGGSAEYHGFLRLGETAEHFTAAASVAMNLAWLSGCSLVLRDCLPVFDALKSIEAAWNSGQPEGRLVAQCLTINLFSQMQSLEPELVQMGEGVLMKPADHRLLHHIVSVIGGLYANPALTVDDIARECAVSRSTLDKLFQRCLGYGPKTFLRRYRVDRAKELLHRQAYSLQEVAEMAGFRDVFSFSRIFKRYGGCSPSRFGPR